MAVGTDIDKGYKKIYHRKWNTEENKVYHAQLRSICGIDNSQIPLAWAREIYELIRELQQRTAEINILSIKEKLFEFKLHYTLPMGTRERAELIEWIEDRLAHTRLILILKNSYPFSIKKILQTLPEDLTPEQRRILTRYEGMSHAEIQGFRNREPKYKDSLLLDETLPDTELHGAYHYLDEHFPKWKESLNSFDSETSSQRNYTNPRLQVMLKLATKYSIYPPISIDSSEEILALDKFSEERTRALFGNDILMQLALRLYEKGDRDSLKRIQLGEWTSSLRQMENELFCEKEKSILVENIIAFFKVKAKRDPMYSFR